MLRWLADIASVRVTSEKNDDGREDIEDNDDNMMTELILAEVEAIVVAFENEQDIRKSQECLRKRVPDYSWLISDVSQKPKKYLTMNAASSREHIFDCFVSSVHEVILSRPRPPTVSDVVRKYIRSASSVNAVADSPRIFGSTRSMANVSFRELSEIV
ncbi:unnamed protein product [Heligmosomoides polygyrus]|uniref:Exocyst subunit Exo70 family protein n=1 Tax=Heligmosomoides polygyrus TaxID=6339 RepID=A0A183GL63_HELPZ|nr:unnamed protein product [Heligmosomoides polygyrus]